MQYFTNSNCEIVNLTFTLEQTAWFHHILHMWYWEGFQMSFLTDRGNVEVKKLITLLSLSETDNNSQTLCIVLFNHVYLLLLTRLAKRRDKCHLLFIEALLTFNLWKEETDSRFFNDKGYCFTLQRPVLFWWRFVRITI